MFGSSLLVAPVFAEDTDETAFYLPEGTWTSFWNAEDVVTGPKWVKRKVAYDEIPVFVKENTILALGKSGIARPDYDYTSDLEVRVYCLAEEGSKATTTIPTGKGAGKAALLTAINKDGKVSLDVSDGSLNGSWSLALIRDGKVSGPSTNQGAHGIIG